MEKEWSRCSTSFSSVPAFTHWERDTVDYRGREEETQEVGGAVNLRVRQRPSGLQICCDLPWDCWGRRAAAGPPLCRSHRPPPPPPPSTGEQAAKKVEKKNWTEKQKLQMN